MTRLALAVFVFLVLLPVSFMGIWFYDGKTIGRLEERIAEVKTATVPLRFMLLSRGDEGISARFRFYDADDNEISVFERSWQGKELNIDCLVLPFGSRTFVFPISVYTELLPPSKGTELSPYYVRRGMPLIYESSALSARERKIIKKIFKGVQNEKHRSRKHWGTAVHDIQSLSVFEVGAIYSLVVRPTGGIELIRE